MYPNFPQNNPQNMMSGSQGNAPMNPVVQLFGNVQNFQNRFSAFQHQIAQQRINPQMQVQSLLNSGQMSQEQFNYFRNIANQILGTNN